MSFNTLDFVFLLIGTVILFYILPYKARNPLLLLVSYAFYAAYDLRLTLFLIVSTLINYFAGRLIQRQKDRDCADKAKAILTLVLLIDVGVLAFFKYFNFFSDILSGLLGSAGIKKSLPQLSLLAPLGISFITFQVVSYVIDINRGKIAAEKSLFRFALYAAFFPKVVQGPIEKAGDFLPQIDKEHRFDIKRFREGLLMVLYGLFMKMVVADKAAIAVNTIYGSVSSQTGAAVALGSVLFSLQIYYDFAGYSLTAIGAARMLGYDFRTNFSHPYLSLSAGEFWRRWHMSLNRWLRDYIYIPLGGNRCSKGRKDFNTLVTFGISGLWHGADWGFVIWGLLNGFYVVIEGRIQALRGKIRKKKASRENTALAAPSHPGLRKAFSGVVTFLLINFAWIFFRTRKLSTAVRIIKRFGKFNFSGFVSEVSAALSKGAGSTLFGLDVVYGLGVLVLGIVIVTVTDVIGEKTDIAGRLADGARWLRWIVYLLLIFAIILFGVYGYGYDAATFIYADF